MRRKPNTTGPSWVSLHEAAERLSRYFGDFTRLALNDVLARGRVPVLAMRRDVVAMLPDRVEGLLAQASEINVIPDNNAILAHYRFASEQDAHQVLGRRSHFTWGDPVSGGLIVNLDFDQVRLCWKTLLDELRRVDWGPTHEAALRKLELSPDCWEPVEAPQEAEPPSDTLKAAPDPEIHKAITAAYDTAEAKSEKPPNLREIIKPVQVILCGQDYTASGRQIQKLAETSQYQSRRRKPGRTVASEMRRKPK